MNKAIMLLITTFMIGSLNAQDKFQNINFLFANKGFGIGYEFESFIRTDRSIGLDLKLYDIRNDEFAVYNPYSNQINIAGEKDILIVPIFFKSNFYLSNNRIENKIKPYFTFAIGPFIAIDADENISSFSEKWTSTKSQTNLGTSLGFGLNFYLISGNNISVGIGYDYFNVDRPIHSIENFGGGFLFFKYQIGRE